MCSRLMGTALELSYNSMELFVGSWHWLYLHRFACSISTYSGVCLEEMFGFE